MGASQLLTRMRSCEGKRRYIKASDTRAVVLSMRRAEKAQNIVAYHCRCCGGWHIGHERPSAL
jgi:hypothetical protein